MISQKEIIKTSLDKVEKILSNLLTGSDMEEHVNSILKKIEEDNIKEDKRQSKDYADKKEYFISIGNKFEYYHEKHNM